MPFPKEIKDKILDSLAGADKDGNIVPSPLLLEREKYGPNFFPAQTVFKDRRKALRVFVDFVNNLLKSKNLSAFHNLGNRFPEGGDQPWEREDYRNINYEGDVIDVVADEKARNSKFDSGNYFVGDLVKISTTDNIDPWDSNAKVGAVHVLNEKGGFDEVGIDSHTIRLKPEVVLDEGASSSFTRYVFNSIYDVLLEAERNSLMFSLLREMLVQHPSADWFVKTSYVSARTSSYINTSSFVRPDEIGASIASLEDSKPYRTKIRSPAFAYTLEAPDGGNVQVDELNTVNHQKVFFDRLNARLEDENVWNGNAWNIEEDGWNSAFWRIPEELDGRQRGGRKRTLELKENDIVEIVDDSITFDISSYQYPYNFEVQGRIEGGEEGYIDSQNIELFSGRIKIIDNQHNIKSYSINYDRNLHEGSFGANGVEHYEHFFPVLHENNLNIPSPAMNESEEAFIDRYSQERVAVDLEDRVNIKVSTIGRSYNGWNQATWNFVHWNGSYGNIPSVDSNGNIVKNLDAFREFDRNYMDELGYDDSSVFGMFLFGNPNSIFNGYSNISFYNNSFVKWDNDDATDPGKFNVSWRYNNVNKGYYLALCFPDNFLEKIPFGEFSLVLYNSNDVEIQRIPVINHDWISLKGAEVKYDYINNFITRNNETCYLYITQEDFANGRHTQITFPPAVAYAKWEIAQRDLRSFYIGINSQKPLIKNNNENTKKEIFYNFLETAEDVASGNLKHIYNANIIGGEEVDSEGSKVTLGSFTGNDSKYGEIIYYDYRFSDISKIQSTGPMGGRAVDLVNGTDYEISSDAPWSFSPLGNYGIPASVSIPPFPDPEYEGTLSAEQIAMPVHFRCRVRLPTGRAFNYHNVLFEYVMDRGGESGMWIGLNSYGLRFIVGHSGSIFGSLPDIRPSEIEHFMDGELHTIEWQIETGPPSRLRAWIDGELMQLGGSNPSPYEITNSGEVLFWGAGEYGYLKRSSGSTTSFLFNQTSNPWPTPENSSPLEIYLGYTGDSLFGTVLGPSYYKVFLNNLHSEHRGRYNIENIPVDLNYAIDNERINITDYGNASGKFDAGSRNLDNKTLLSSTGENNENRITLEYDQDWNSYNGKLKTPVNPFAIITSGMEMVDVWLPDDSTETIENGDIIGFSTENIQWKGINIPVGYKIIFRYHPYVWDGVKFEKGDLIEGEDVLYYDKKNSRIVMNGGDVVPDNLPVLYHFGERYLQDENTDNWKKRAEQHNVDSSYVMNRFWTVNEREFSRSLPAGITRATLFAPLNDAGDDFSTTGNLFARNIIRYKDQE